MCGSVWAIASKLYVLAMMFIMLVLTMRRDFMGDISSKYISLSATCLVLLERGIEDLYSRNLAVTSLSLIDSRNYMGHFADPAQGIYDVMLKGLSQLF